MSSFGIPLSSTWISSKVNPGIAPHRSSVTGTNGVSGSSGAGCYCLKWNKQGSLPWCERSPAWLGNGEITTHHEDFIVQKELAPGVRVGRSMGKQHILKSGRPLPVPTLMYLESIWTSRAGCIAGIPGPSCLLWGLCHSCHSCHLNHCFVHTFRYSLNLLSLTNTIQPGSYLLLLQVCVLLPCHWLPAGKIQNAWESVSRGAGQNFLYQGAAVLHMALSCPCWIDSSSPGVTKGTVWSPSPSCHVS